MIVYIPTPITSAEQAESLPYGTVLTHPEEWPIERVLGRRLSNGIHTFSPEEVAADGRFTALLPIEAKEETTRAEPFADGTIHVSPQYWRDEPSRRLATPWEPVSDPSTDHSLDGREAHE